MSRLRAPRRSRRGPSGRRCWSACRSTSGWPLASSRRRCSSARSACWPASRTSGKDAGYLPDPHPGGRLDPELVGSADAKRGIELVEIPDDLVAAELVGGMRVDGEQPDDLLVPALHLPGPGPRHEEALGAGQAVDHRCLFPVQRHQISLPGDAEAAEVPDVLSDRQRSVHVLVRSLLRRQRVVLLDQRPGPGVERLSVSLPSPSYFEPWSSKPWPIS